MGGLSTDGSSYDKVSRLKDAITEERQAAGKREPKASSGDDGAAEAEDNSEETTPTHTAVHEKLIARGLSTEALLQCDPNLDIVPDRPEHEWEGTQHECITRLMDAIAAEKDAGRRQRHP